MSRASAPQIPIVENEIKRESGEGRAEEEVTVAPAQKLVTEMGTYVTQSALSSSRPSKKEEDRCGGRHYVSTWPFISSVLVSVPLGGCLCVCDGAGVVSDPRSEAS